MNIFELLSFDIVEFVTSIEGILIIVGILFLIIGIILLCMGKGKKKETLPAQPEVNSSLTPENIVPTPAVSNSSVVTQEVPKVETPVVNEPQLVQTPTVLNNTEEAKPIIVPSTTGGLQESATTPVVEPINFSSEVKNDDVKVENVVVDNAVDNKEKIESLDVGTSTEKLNVSMENNIPSPSTSINESVTPVTVYGGNNPETVIKKENLDEKPREIYGGANPLENTAPIPTNTVREAYSGGVVSSSTVAPTSDTKISDTKIEASAAPVVEPKVDSSLNEQTNSAATLSSSSPAPVATEPSVVAPVQESMVSDKKEEIEKLEF